MRKLTAEWVAKAEEDYSVAAGLLRRRKVPADSVCFHCQQAAEKHLKAILQEHSLHFGKTHDLEALVRLCTPRSPEIGKLSADARLLGDYAVRYRYPGMDATKAQARRAMEAARRIRKSVRKLLKL